MKILGSFRLWLVALCVVAVVVVVDQPATGPRARVAHLESLVRCPACEDLSVAQSNATSAIAVRHEIVARVRAGQSDTTILTSLERVYGPTILLSPPTSGLGSLLYLGPLAILVVLAVVATRLWRRR